MFICQSYVKSFMHKCILLLCFSKCYHILCIPGYFGGPCDVATDNIFSNLLSSVTWSDVLPRNCSFFSICLIFWILGYKWDNFYSRVLLFIERSRFQKQLLGNNYHVLCSLNILSYIIRWRNLCECIICFANRRVENQRDKTAYFKNHTKR